MPIAFPRPSGAEPSYIRDWWKRLATKAFDVVPAPAFGNVGDRLSSFRMEPGKAVQKAVNLRNLGFGYQDPCQSAVVNPAAALMAEMLDETNADNRVLGRQNERIVGVSRDATGLALAGCTVHVFRTADDVLVASAVSDGSGNWTVYPNQRGPYYFVEYLAGSPDVFGTTPNTNTSTQFTPGQ
jgi:hypothetical protein